MQNLPVPQIYEDEYLYMPWGIIIMEILNRVKKAPVNARVLDLLCGSGYVLGKVKSIRPDLDLTGVDIQGEYIEYAKYKYQDIRFITADVLNWDSNKKYDLVLVTNGVHHLPFEKQENFIKKVARLLSPGGQAIIADPYIEDYFDEEERKLAAARLGYEYLAVTIKNGATDDVIRAATDVMTNDIFLVEFKNSIKKMKPLYEKYFKTIEMYKTWPQEISQYGDYYFVLKK
jgi:SAM-dependent methyltransferase